MAGLVILVVHVFPKKYPHQSGKGDGDKKNPQIPHVKDIRATWMIVVAMPNSSVSKDASEKIYKALFSLLYFM